MSPADSQIDQLKVSEIYRLPVLERILDFLAPPSGSLGLEVGCGIGSLTLPLAGRLGPCGRVIGLDIDDSLLARAAMRAKGLKQGGRVEWLKGDMTALPFESRSFDWLISLDCAGHIPPDEPATLIRELARVVKPGGFIGLAAWSGQTLLPGYADLEARLNATRAGLAPLEPDTPEESHFCNALSWFEKTGLVQGRTASLEGRIQAPLSLKEKAALEDLLAMRWTGAERELNPPEAELFISLTDPDSVDFILNQKDFVARFSYRVFKALKP